MHRDEQLKQSNSKRDGSTIHLINLIGFFKLSAVKGLHSLLFATITNPLADHYKVANLTIHLTSIIFLLTPIILIIPLPTRRLSRRVSLTLSATSVLLGCIIKSLTGLQANKLHLVLLGQLFISLGDVIHSDIKRESEIESRRYYVALFGEKLGQILAFALPWLLCNISFQSGVEYIFYGSTVLAAIAVSLILVRPPAGPTKESQHHDPDLSQAQSSTVLNGRSILQLFVVYGLGGGCCLSIAFLLNELILAKPSVVLALNSSSQFGFSLMTFSVLGSLLGCRIFKQIQSYEQVFVSSALACLVTLLGFCTCILYEKELGLYLLTIPLGMSSAIVMDCSMNHAIAMKQPVAGIAMNVIASLSIIMVSLLTSDQLLVHGLLAGGLVLSGLLLASLLVGLLLAIAQGSKARQVAFATDAVPTGEKSVQQQDEKDAVGPSPKRYLILLMFVILATIKSFQWICLASVTNLLSVHYGVSNVAINWTAMAFMVTFLGLALPVNWCMDRIGVRNSILIGTAGITLGLVIKCFSCGRDGFAIGMVGHLIIGFVEPFFYSIYGKLASIWFPDEQVSLASSIGIAGDEIGIALGFVVPGLLLGSNPYDTQAIERGLFQLFLAMTVISALNSLLIVLFFDEQPERPPGIARLKQIEAELREPRLSFRDFARQYTSLLNRSSFINALTTYGIIQGANYSLHTLLNQAILAEGEQSWSNATMLVGYSGAVYMLVGCLGLVCAGHLLDRCHKYKQACAGSSLASMVSMAALTWSLLTHNELALYLTLSALGFFTAAYQASGIELAVELQYPRSEVISSTLLNLAAQVFGIPLTYAGTFLVDIYGNLALGGFFCAVFLVSSLLAICQKGKMRRQLAVQSGECST